jgi:adhesin/invasin
MQVHRKSWKTDVTMLLTLVMLFSPILSGLDAAWLGVATKAAAQQPSPTPSAVQPILVVPLKAAEGVPANIAGRMTYALISELTASKRYSPTRLSVEDPTIQRLISENLLSQDAVAAVIEEPTPEGIAEIAAAMKIPAAAYGTVDSYTYDPSNGGSVKVQVTVRVLTIDLETVSVVEEKTVEITEEGSSAPKLKPTPEDTLAAEAIYDAAKKIVAKLIGLPPKPPVEIKRPPAVNPVAFLLGALVIAAALSGARGKAGAVPLGPADAPRSVTAVPQVDIIVVSWQPPTRGTPVGYHVYRQTVDLTTFQPIGGVERLTTDPVRTTIYEDRTAQRDRAYIYSVSAVYSDGRESVRISANLGIISPTQPAPVGIGVPLPPANLAAQARDAAVLLTWTDLNPAGLVIGYRIYRNGVQIADETTVRTTTYMDRGLQNNVAYQYFVRAVSSFGLLSAPSATVTAVPGNLPPQAPLNLTARFDPTTKTVTLTWQAPPDPDVAYYEVARVVVPETRMTRGLIERARQPVPTPSTSPTIIQRVLQANPRMRQQAGSEFDANVIASDVRVTTYIDNVAGFMPTPANALTRYQHLRYAVRAVDTSGQKGAWSNVVQVTPNTPPPALMTPPRLIPGNGQIVVDLQPLLEQAQTDPEWQIDKAGVRIFRVTVKGGTSATTLRPIHSEDVLPIPADGKYVDRGVVNGTRYYYAIELVDKLGVPGKRSPEAVATPFATATITITSLRRELSGNGQDSVQLTITALDAASRPVAGLPLKVTLQGVGTLTINPQYDDPYSADPSDAITDDSGQIIATYRAAVISADTTVTITAASTIVTGVSPAQLTLTLRAPVVASVEIQPQQTQLVADGQSFTRVTITVRDRLGNPMPNQTVALSVSPAQGRFEDLNGNPITQVSTGTTGTAEVIYRSGTRAGSVTLTASVGAISGQAVITLIPGSPATIELVATPTTAPADGATEVRITATVKDAYGNAVPNVQVQFTSTPTLTITPTVATTNDTGQATVSVIAPRVAGSYLLRAQVGTISATLTLIFGASAPSTMTMSASRTNLIVSLPPLPEYASLSVYSRTEITATVVDENNNPVRGVVVQFSASAGTIQATATTDAAGVARAIYVAPPAPTGQVTINAQAGAASGSITLDILPGPPAQVTVTATPAMVPADGRSQISVVARVRDANGNPVADGTMVYFSARSETNINQAVTTAGTFLRDSVPTLNGDAQVTFVAGTQPGVRARLVAQAFGTVFGQNFGPIPAETELPRLVDRFPLIQLGGQIVVSLSASEMSVSSRDDTANPADRQPLRITEPRNNFVTLTVQVVDGQGNPAPLSLPVFLTSSDSRVLFVHSGGADLGSAILNTDSSGRAEAQVYASKTAGVVTITAELRDAQNRPFVSRSVTVRQRPGAPAVVVMPTPQPSVIFVPGAGTPTSTTVIARVFDAAGNTVEDGTLISFSADAGTLTPSNVTTSNGVASATLTSSPDTGRFTVRAVARDTGAEGTTTVAFAVNVTAIDVTAQPSNILGDGQATATITANFTGNIPDGTRVQFITDRGFIGTAGQRSARVPVAGNTAQVTFVSEAVTADTTATVRVEAANPQGNIVAGTVQITMTRPPKPPILQPLQVATTTLSVSSSNATDPAQRRALGPEPNSTTVTVTVLEETLNLPVPNATVFLSSSDTNGLWVDGQGNASLGGIQVVTGSDGRATATFYASTAPGQVTLKAQMGAQEQTTTITVMPGNPASIVVAFSGTRTAPDGVPYIFVPGAGTPTEATVSVTVRDAVGNNVRDNTLVTFTVVEGEGTFSPTNTVATVNGRASVTLSSSQATGEFTVKATSGSAEGIGRIRYAANVPDITAITANPTQIPDDGVTKSDITIQLPAPDGTRFRVATDKGTLTFGNQSGSAVVATVTNGQATVEFRGPGNLPSRQDATITAEIVASDGTKKTASTTVTLLPRIEIVEIVNGIPEPLPDFFDLVVSSNNSLDPAARLPLDGVPGNNKKRIQIIVRGPMPSNPTVTFLASEGNVLFDVIEGSNAGTKRLATVSGNLQQFGSGVGQENRYTVDMYASTRASKPGEVYELRIDIPGVMSEPKVVKFRQLPGPPGSIVVTAANSLIPVTSGKTQIIADVRDAVGNAVSGYTVFFSADDGTLYPIASAATDGIATSDLTASNFTRRVRVFAKAINPATQQEVIGFTLVSFVVGNLESIDLVPDKGNIPPGDYATVTVFFNPASQMPDGVRFHADLVGAYGVIESVSTTVAGRATIRVRNNNPTGTNQVAQLTVRVIRQDGVELTKSTNLTLLASPVVQKVEVVPDRNEIVVSNRDDDEQYPPLRQPLQGSPLQNWALLEIYVRELSTSNAETVTITLASTDVNGLFTLPSGVTDQATGKQARKGTVTFSVTDDGAGDSQAGLGTMRILVRYYSSRKAQPVTIYLTAKKGAEDYGSSAIGIFQRPGPVAQSFFTVNPPRIAVNTLAGSEPIEAQLIATLYDANDNPVPDERVSFAIEPVEVVPYSDILAGDANNVVLTRYDLTSLTPYFRAQGGPTAATNDWGPGGVPRGDRYLGFLRFVPSGPNPPLTAQPARPPLVSDGSIVQSEVMTDVNGVAMTVLQSVNVCQPVTLKMVPQSNVALGRKFTTFYYVPVTSIQVTIEQGGLVNGPGSTFTVAFRFNPASALPVGTRVWVRIHGTAYDGDEDGDGLVNEDPPGANNWDDDKDGRIDEDPAGDANGDNNNDDDFDGRTDEDPYGPHSADDDGDGRVDEDWNPALIDGWFTAVVTEPGVIRVSITNQATGPDSANGWKVIQVFVWNRDGIRLMGQTSAIEFR